MKEVSYQVERRTANNKWDAVSPALMSEASARTLLDADRILAHARKSGEVFRLVKTVRTEVRA